MEVEMSWSGIAEDGSEANGKLKVPEVSHEAIDGLSDYVVGVVTLQAGVHTERRPPVRLLPNICRKLGFVSTALLPTQIFSPNPQGKVQLPSTGSHSRPWPTIRKHPDRIRHVYT
jgi:hypothetical protein